MVSDSATLVPTQQSVKAYVDAQVTAQDLDFQADTGGALSIDLDSESLTFTGGTGIDTSGSLNTVTFAIDSTVATLTGTQTLTNKTLTSPDVNTPDIDGGTIDGATIATSNITVGTGKTLDVSSGTLTLANDQISGDKVEGGTIASTTITSLASTTVDTTNVEVTNIKAKDGTSAGSIADITGVVTLASSVLTTTDINGGTIDGATIGATTPAAVSATTVSATGNITVGGTVDGRDVATDGTKLDGIEAGADVTDTTNVTAAGALMDSELTNITAVKSLNQGVATTDSPTFAGLTTTADVSFGDNDKAIFGAGSDLQIYHNGSRSVITDQGTGPLRISATNLEFKNADDTKLYANAIDGGAFNLYYDNASKLATTSTGIDVTGTVTADGLTVEATAATFSGSNFLLNIEDTSAGGSTGIRTKNSLGDETSRIASNDSNDIGFYTTSSVTQRMQIDGNTGDISFYEDTGTTAKLFWDASTERLELSNLKLYSDNVRNEGGILYIGTSGNNATQFYNNDVNTVHISGAGNVGIGTSSPSAALHIANATPVIRLEDTSASVSHYINSNNTELRVQADSALSLRTSGTEALRIDSSGNLLVGKTSVGLASTGFQALASGNQSAFVSDGDRALILNRQTSDGSILEFRKDGTTVGSIQTFGGGSDIKVVFSSDGDQYITGNAASNYLTFSSANAERMRLDSSGNLLVGTTDTDPSNNGSNTSADDGVAINNGEIRAAKYQATANVGAVAYVNRTGSDGDILRFRKSGTAVGSIGVDSGDNLYIGGSAASHGGLYFGTNTAAPLSAGTLTDDVMDLGTATYRFDDVYATNGTINTSDRNEKQDIEALSDAEQRVAVACKGLLRKFRWKSSVAENGDDARIHFGIIAQDLQAAFEAEGLDAGRYAMFINSTWTDEETGEERSRMGVRYSELLAFIIAAI